MGLRFSWCEPLEDCAELCAYAAWLCREALATHGTRGCRSRLRGEQLLFLAQAALEKGERSRKSAGNPWKTVCQFVHGNPLEVSVNVPINFQPTNQNDSTIARGRKMHDFRPYLGIPGLCFTRSCSLYWRQCTCSWSAHSGTSMRILVHGLLQDAGESIFIRCREDPL